MITPVCLRATLRHSAENETKQFKTFINLRTLEDLQLITMVIKNSMIAQILLDKGLDWFEEIDKSMMTDFYCCQTNDTTIQSYDNKLNS